VAVLGDIARRLDDIIDARALRRVSNLSRYAVAAARLALARGGSAPETADGTAILLGTSFGSAQYHFDYYEKLALGGLREASPLLFSECVMNAAPGHVAMALGLRGASLALVGGEEVGLAAVAEGAERLRLGDAAAVLAGGGEEYCDFVHAGLGRRGFVTSARGEPFAGREAPPFFGEGAALLHLEPEATARASGAPVLALVAGWGAARSGKAGGEAEAVERAARLALNEARLAPQDLDLVVASASGGPLDAAEARGLGRALSAPRARPLLVAAPKAALGEGFAFTSAAQAAVAVLALREGVVPPSPGAAPPVLLPPGFELVREPRPSAPASALAVSINRRGAAAAVVFTRG
jgi:3-oxoacyl-(acyl-carrier-protein) synthase